MKCECDCHTDRQFEEHCEKCHPASIWFREQYNPYKQKLEHKPSLPNQEHLPDSSRHNTHKKHGQQDLNKRQK